MLAYNTLQVFGVKIGMNVISLSNEVEKKTNPIKDTKKLRDKTFNLNDPPHQARLQNY